MIPVIPIALAAGVAGVAYYLLKPSAAPVLPPAPPPPNPNLFTKKDLVDAKIVTPAKKIAVDIGPATPEYTQDQIWAGSLTQKTSTDTATDALTGGALGAMGIVNTQKDPLMLRSLPSVGSAVLKSMVKGSPLTLLNEVSQDGKWIKVVSQGVPGWAYREFIKQV
jgi:hypothetical protein